MELVRRRPTGLWDGVLVGMTGYRERTSSVLTNRMPAAAMFPVILSFGEPLELELADRSTERFGSFVAGLSPSPATTHQSGEYGCVQIDLTPLGAYRLLGIPGVELAGRAVELSDLPTPLSRASVADELASLPSWDRRFACVDRLIGAMLASGPEPDPIVLELWRRIVTTHGQVKVSAFVEEAGRSHRYVTSRFREQVGLTPKAVAGIIRFERALRMLRSDGPPLPDVAYRCGYADQSHLTREFGRLAGCSPGRFRSRPERELSVPSYV